MATATKRVVGRPFVKGDPRINRGGRPPAVLTRAMMGKLTEERADRIMDAVIVAAEAGESWAIALLWDRLEGKAIARNESGDPGAFDLDLSDVDTAQLKAALKRVK